MREISDRNLLKTEGIYTKDIFFGDKMVNKKGVSAVVATVGLLLLTVVAVSVLIAFVVPFVRNNLYESTECLDYSEYFQFSEKFEKFNCYAIEVNGRQLYRVSIGAKNVENKTGREVEGFELVFYGDDKSEVVDVMEGDNPDENADSWIYMLNKSNEKIKIPQPGETRTYEYNATGWYSEVEIYVKLKSGKVCPDLSDSIRIIDEACLP